MRRAQELELGIGPQPPGSTLQRWLYGELRASILSGRIKAGQRLPSSRELARQQGISRGTVLSVYEQLAAEGYLAGTTGSGTKVACTLPAVAPAPEQPATAAAPRGQQRLSRQGERLAASPFPVFEAATPLRTFRANQPDLHAFPVAIWHKLQLRCSKATDPKAMGYGEAAGLRSLRQAIADHLRYSQRIVCRAEQVMILGSAQQGLDLCARLLLDPGDSVLVEDPGYPGASHVFGLTGAKVIGMPVDHYGMKTDPALPVTPDMRLAYVTAAHQSPLGGVMPIERRLALLAWAEACNATIIEDDYDSEYRFKGTPLSALKSLDQGERVIYMGTFSKLLYPSLRLAYLVVPDDLVDAFASAISLTCRHVSRFQQEVLSLFIAEGHFARHLRHMRLLYGERAEIFQQACQAHLHGLVSVPPITTGLDATAVLPAHANDLEVANYLGSQGIEARPLSFYRVKKTPAPGLVLGFSAFDGDAIRAGIAAMGQALERCLR